MLSALFAALLSVALILFFAAPATADDDADLQLAVQQGNLQAQAGGQPTTLVFSVTNNGPGNANDFIANVTIPFGDKGVTVASSNPPCNQNNSPTVLACQVGELDAGQSTVFTLVIAAPPANSLAPTDSFSGTGGAQVTSNNDPNDSNDSGQFTLSLTGAPPAVTSITGTVTNGSTSQPIVGASVVSRDVNGATCPATTDANGTFTCSPNPGLAGGQITVEATMAGFQLSRTTVTPTNGAVANVQLVLSPAAASPSPTPSLAPSTPAATTAQAGTLKSKSGFPWDTLLLIVGIVIALAALGGGAWWIYRRKDKEPPPGGPQGDLAGAESLLPTMALRIPNSIGSDTTVATPPPFGMEQPTHRPELPVGAGANASTAVWGAPQGAASGAGANASTAVWGANAAWSQPGGWAPAGSPPPDWSPEQAGPVNRSTEPIPVSGSATGRSAPANSGDGERTAEWPTVDPEPGQGVQTAGSALNESTAAWPAPQSAPPYTPQSAPPYTPQSAPPYTPQSAPPYQASAPPYTPQSAPPYQASAPPYQASAPPYQASAPPYQASAPPYSAPPAQPFPASGPPSQPYPVSAPPKAQYSVSSPPAAHWSASANPAGRPPDRYSPSAQQPPQAQQLGNGDAHSWRAAQPYPPQPGNNAYSAVPGEAPPPNYGYYEGSTPGAPLAGWDTPPAVVPSTPASYSPPPPSGYADAHGPIPPAPPGPPPAAPRSGSPASAPPWNGAAPTPSSAPPWNGAQPGSPPPPWNGSAPPWQPAGQQTPPPPGYQPAGYPSAPGQPYPTSGPPLGSPPVGAPPASGPPASGPPASGPPASGGYPSDYGTYRPAAPEPAEPDPRQWWSDQNPR